MVLTRPGCHHAYPERGEGFCVFNHTAVVPDGGSADGAAPRFSSPTWMYVMETAPRQSSVVIRLSPFSPCIQFGSIYPRTGAAAEQG